MVSCQTAHKMYLLKQTKKQNNQNPDFKGIYHHDHLPATMGLFGFLIAFALFSLRIAILPFTSSSQQLTQNPNELYLTQTSQVDQYSSRDYYQAYQVSQDSTARILGASDKKLSFWESFKGTVSAWFSFLPWMKKEKAMETFVVEGPAPCEVDPTCGERGAGWAFDGNTCSCVEYKRDNSGICPAWNHSAGQIVGNICTGCHEYKQICYTNASNSCHTDEPTERIPNPRCDTTERDCAQNVCRTGLTDDSVCNELCPSPPVCGNGYLEAEEVCDKSKNCLTGKNGEKGCADACVGGSDGYHGYPNNGRGLDCKSDCSGYSETIHYGKKYCDSQCTTDPHNIVGVWGISYEDRIAEVGTSCADTTKVLNDNCECVARAEAITCPVPEISPVADTPNGTFINVGQAVTFTASPINSTTCSNGQVGHVWYQIYRTLGDTNQTSPWLSSNTWTPGAYVTSGAGTWQVRAAVTPSQYINPSTTIPVTPTSAWSTSKSFTVVPAATAISCDSINSNLPTNKQLVVGQTATFNCVGATNGAVYRLFKGSEKIDESSQINTSGYTPDVLRNQAIGNYAVICNPCQIGEDYNQCISNWIETRSCMKSTTDPANNKIYTFSVVAESSGSCTSLNCPAVVCKTNGCNCPDGQPLCSDSEKVCTYVNKANGTSCTSSGLPGACQSGTCVPSGTGGLSCQMTVPSTKRVFIQRTGAATFTCRGTDIDKAEFQVLNDNNVVVIQPTPIPATNNSATWNRSFDLGTGNYLVQCRVCKGSDCSTWGGASTQ